MFVPEVTTVGGEAAVFRDLDVGHAPRPEHSDIIRSAGAAGLLMRFSRPAMVPDVLQALDSPARPALPGIQRLSISMQLEPFASVPVEVKSSIL